MTFLGSECFQAPEMLMLNEYDEVGGPHARRRLFCGKSPLTSVGRERGLLRTVLQRVDIFSYGVVLCELLSRQPPSMSVFGRRPPNFGVDPNEIAYASRR